MLQQKSSFGQTGNVNFATHPLHSIGPLTAHPIWKSIIVYALQMVVTTRQTMQWRFVLIVIAKRILAR